MEATAFTHPSGSPLTEEQKRLRARTILREAREEILSILWETDPQEYCNDKFLLVWLEEDYEYALRSLGLGRRSESTYLGRLHRIFGQYSEVIAGPGEEGTPHFLGQP